MAKLFKDKLLTIIITLSISLFIGCSKEEMQMNTYRFISYSCISDASDCSEIYNTFPINENFIIYDTQSNADAQMIEMFKNYVSIVDSKELGKKIIEGDYCRIHLCEIKDGESLQIIRDITCKEWRHIE
jgi:predicted ATP-grasp superfamily ATP-dependent carboligase